MPQYDRAFVEPGPLPPHERTWRHPSELGPTRADVEGGSSRYDRAAALVSGTLAVLAIAAIVVAVTPRRSDAPVTLSATTTPAFATFTPATAAIVGQGSDAVATTGGASRPASVARSASRTAVQLASFSAMPNSVASAPELTLDGSSIAVDEPADDAAVFVRIETVTYRVEWGHVGDVAMPDGSVVFDGAGDLVAYVSRGDLVNVVDD